MENMATSNEYPETIEKGDSDSSIKKLQKDTDEEFNLDIDNIKDTLSARKNTCSTFQTNIEIIEKRYSEGDEEKFIL